MKKGQVVKCVITKGPNLTNGKNYVITAGKGDPRNSFTGDTKPLFKDEHAMITDNDGDSITIILPECAFGVWEVVS